MLHQSYASQLSETKTELFLSQLEPIPQHFEYVKVEKFLKRPHAVVTHCCSHTLLNKGMLTFISPEQLEKTDLKSAFLSSLSTVIFVKIHFQISAHCQKNWKIKFFYIF